MVGDLLKFNVLHHSLIFYGNCQRENCEHRNKAITERPKRVEIE
jgi:Fur family ferric uptake transcriptional regulator